MKPDVSHASRVGANLRQRRKALGLTLTHVAEEVTRLGVPLVLNVLSRIERGERPPRVKEMLALAAVLDMDLDDCFAKPRPSNPYVDAIERVRAEQR